MLSRPGRMASPMPIWHGPACRCMIMPMRVALQGCHQGASGAGAALVDMWGWLWAELEGICYAESRSPAAAAEGPGSTFFNRVPTGVGLESEDVRGCFGKLLVSTLRGCMGLGGGSKASGMRVDLLQTCQYLSNCE